MVYQCVWHTAQEDQVTGKVTRNNSENKKGKVSVWASIKVKVCYEKVASEDRPPEHCAGLSARKHGLLEENHRTH